MSFQIVTRKPIQAFLFEGGAANATPIINQILQNGDTATWTEGHDSWFEHLRIQSGERVVRIFVGNMFVYEDGMYQRYEKDQFRRAFDSAPGTPAWGAEDVKEQKTTPPIGKRSFVTRAQFAEAIQVPVKTFQEADKDLEERMRAVAAFVVNNGGEVGYMAKEWLDVNLEGRGAESVSGPDWIVKNPEGRLEHLEDAQFRAKYQEVEL